MLIKQGDGIATGKLLLPESRLSWRPSSQRRTFEPLDHGIETRWSLTAVLDDGHPVWRGWFDDRDDADEFLFAMAEGTLKSQRALWDLPGKLSQPDFEHLLNWDGVPGGEWRPDIPESARYILALTQTITSPVGSNTDVVIPLSWNNFNNRVHGIGGGGAGGSWQDSGARNATGGGGGRYTFLNNHVVAAPGTTTRRFNLSVSRPGSTAPGQRQGTTGTAGSATTMLGADNSTVVLSAGGGLGGTSTRLNTTNGGAGGSGSTGTGGNNGGRGGNVTTGGAGAPATGGGAAGGPGGVGGTGTDTVGAVNAGTNGGLPSGTNAGGGGNGVSDVAKVGGPGSNYGGGGGGCVATSASVIGGTGAQGVAWLEWWPAVPGFNMPMLGM